jgi:hypothetical protein
MRDGERRGRKMKKRKRKKKKDQNRRRVKRKETLLRKRLSMFLLKEGCLD